MKFKVLKGTELFESFMAWTRKRGEYDQAATDFTKKIGEQLGGDEKGTHIGLGGDIVAGGISGFKLDKQPENWRKAWPKDYKGFYFPMIRKVNADILKEIAALPKMTRQDLNDIIGFQPHFGDRIYYRGFGISFHKEHILIDVANEAPFTPVDGMTEILESEYIKLSKAK